MERDCSIFLVDDDADDREFFSEALEEVDGEIELTVFSRGQDLLEKLRSIDRLPYIVFVDLYMPIMDGEECLIKIREDERWGSVCVVIYSTMMDMDRIEELFNVGANRYLKKPSTYPALKNALLTAIESVKNNPLGVQSIIHYSE